MNAVHSVSSQARMLTVFCGMALCIWTLSKTRKRTLLISICSIFIGIGLALVLFGLVPGVFDGISDALGVKYPPLLYLLGAILTLMIVTIHLASRLSLLDERCRRLAQELALMKAFDPQR